MGYINWWPKLCCTSPYRNKCSPPSGVTPQWAEPEAFRELCSYALQQDLESFQNYYLVSKVTWIPWFQNMENHLRIHSPQHIKNDEQNHCGLLPKQVGNKSIKSFFQGTEKLLPFDDMWSLNLERLKKERKKELTGRQALLILGIPDCVHLVKWHCISVEKSWCHLTHSHYQCRWTVRAG